jgi:Ca2+-binding EF-hand superfamily protein
LFNSLSTPAVDHSTTAQGFYPLAQFATHNRLFKLPKPIKFPPTLLLSQNYFKTGWSFNTYRRIRNVIMVMDWVPDVSQSALRLREMHDMKVKTRTVHTESMFETLCTDGSSTVLLILSCMCSFLCFLQYQPVLTDKQSELVNIAFKLFNLRGDGKLSADEFRAMLSALDVYLSSEDDLRDYIRLIDWGGDGLDIEDAKRMMRFQQYMRMQQGRYQVALTLHEAESIRGIMHMHLGGPIIPLSPTAIALRVNASGSVMDSTQSWYPAGEYQATLEQQLYRFVDSDMGFKEREAHMLLRALQPNPCDEREIWWSEIRSCRLRTLIDWKLSPLKLVFTVPDEYYLLQYRAYIARIRGILRQRQMGLLDAYRLFDVDRSGDVSYEEFYGAITWLGLGDQCTGLQVQEMCLAMDPGKTGMILYPDFVRHLRDPNEEFEIEQAAEDAKVTKEQQAADLAWLGMDLMTGTGGGSGAGGSTNTMLSVQDNAAWMELIAGSAGTEHHAAWKSQYGDIKPRVLFPEKLQSASSLEASQRDLKSRIFKAAEKIRIEVNRVSGYTSIWDSKGSMSRTKVSVWAGHLLRNKNYRASVCVGHYATQGFNKPSDKNFYLTVSDSSSVLGWFKSKSCYLILNALCPHPLKFRQVWMSRGGEKSLYAWEAVPPTKDFVALGHVFTTSPDEPALSEVRCVPRVWCVPAIVEPKCIWDDAGGGGRRGSIWVINSLSNVCVVEGHEKPKGREFYDLVQNKFMATLNLDKMDWGDKGGASSSAGGALMDSKWKASLDSWMDQWEEDEIEDTTKGGPAAEAGPVVHPFDTKEPGVGGAFQVTSARAAHVAANYANYALSSSTAHTEEDKKLFVQHHAELQALIEEEEQRAEQAAQSHVELKPGEVNRPAVPTVPSFALPTPSQTYTADWLPRDNELTPEINARFASLATAPTLASTYVPEMPKPIKPVLPQLPEIQAPMSSIGATITGAGSYGAGLVANSGGYGSYGASSAGASSLGAGAAAAASSYSAPSYVAPEVPRPIKGAYVPPPPSAVTPATSLAAATGRRKSGEIIFEKLSPKLSPSPAMTSADSAAFAGMSLSATASSATAAGKPPAARKPATSVSGGGDDMFALMNVKAAAPPAAKTPTSAAPAAASTTVKHASPQTKPTVVSPASSSVSPTSAAAAAPAAPADSSAGMTLLPDLMFGVPAASPPSSSKSSSSASSSSSSGVSFGATSLLPSVAGDAPLADLGPMTLTGPGGVSRAPPPSKITPKSASSSSSAPGNDLDIFSGMQTKSAAATSSASSADAGLDLFGLSPAAVAKPAKTSSASSALDMFAGMTTASTAAQKARSTSTVTPPVLAPPPAAASGIIPIGGATAAQTSTASLFPISSSLAAAAASPLMSPPAASATSAPVADLFAPAAAAPAAKPAQTGFVPPSLGAPAQQPQQPQMQQAQQGGMGQMTPQMLAQFQQMTPQQQAMYQQQQLMLSMTPVQLQQFGLQRGMNAMQIQAMLQQQQQLMMHQRQMMQQQAAYQQQQARMQGINQLGAQQQQQQQMMMQQQQMQMRMQQQQQQQQGAKKDDPFGFL